MDALHRAQAALAVNDIYISRIDADVAPDFLPSVPLTDQELSAQTRHSVADDIQQAELQPEDPQENVIRLVRYRVRTAIRIVRKGGQRSSAEEPDSNPSEPDVCARLEVTFVAQYTVTDEGATDNEALSAFAEQNVLYHVWPYWREFAQSTFQRMRIAPIMIPMYRPQTAPVDSNPSGSPDSEEKS